LTITATTTTMIKIICLSTIILLSTTLAVATKPPPLSSLSSSTSSSIPATLKLGNHLLSKKAARRRSRSRRQLNNNDDDVDYSWVQGYSMKFESCHTISEFRADGGGGSNDEEDASPVEMKRLVKFKLCPTVEDDGYDYGQYEYTSSCGKCKNGAEYLVEMREFLEAYLDFQLTQQEYNCEQVEENCNYDDDAGLTTCYTAANLDYCDQFASNDGDDNYEFELEDYLECENVLEDQDDDYNRQRLYVGAYCSNDGKAIYLGEFQDRQCTTSATSGAYLTLFGHNLPYQETSLVNGEECLSCLEPPENDDDANNDNNDDDAVREICEELYEQAAKCEENLADDVATTKATGACDYIHNTLPQTEKILKNGGSGSGMTASTVFAGLFFVSTVAATAYALMLYQKIEHAKSSLKVDLSASDGEVA